jgi:hypothetical protein
MQCPHPVTSEVLRRGFLKIGTLDGKGRDIMDLKLRS